MVDEDFKLLDKDEDEESGESPAKYRLPFALCKRYGIELPDWATPRDAWNALKGRGISPEREYEAMKEKRESSRRSRERAKEKKKLIEAQMKDPEHIPDVNYKHKDGYIAGAKKGKPMTHAEANGKRVNPFYDSEYRDSGYSANCAMCVAAYEARRRGYDVRALPYQGKELEIALAADISFAYVGGRLQSPKGRGGKDFLEKTVKDNERYAFSYDSFNLRSRHVIIAFREKGELTLYDPQKGEIFKGREISKKLIGTSKERLLRIDNLEFNPEVINFIVKRR